MTDPAIIEEAVRNVRIACGDLDPLGADVAKYVAEYSAELDVLLAQDVSDMNFTSVFKLYRAIRDIGRRYPKHEATATALKDRIAVWLGDEDQ